MLQGLRFAAIGVGAGTAAALALEPLLASFLFGVNELDYWAIAIASACLLVVSAAACVVPAFRATRIDPLIALRQE